MDALTLAGTVLCAAGIVLAVVIWLYVRLRRQLVEVRTQVQHVTARDQLDDELERRTNGGSKRRRHLRVIKTGGVVLAGIGATTGAWVARRVADHPVATAAVTAGAVLGTAGVMVLTPDQTQPDRGGPPSAGAPATPAPDTPQPTPRPMQTDTPEPEPPEPAPAPTTDDEPRQPDDADDDRDGPPGRGPPDEPPTDGDGRGPPDDRPDRGDEDKGDGERRGPPRGLCVDALEVVRVCLG